MSPRPPSEPPTESTYGPPHGSPHEPPHGPPDERTAALIPPGSGSLRAPGRILLISCYELGHAPHGLAMPLAFLEQAGFAPHAVDLSIDPLRDALVDQAALVAISVPMHTALRLGVRVAARIRARNPAARICFFGLYAPLNREHLLGSGSAHWVLGGESEAALVALAQALDSSLDSAMSSDPAHAPQPLPEGLPDGLPEGLPEGLPDALPPRVIPAPPPIHLVKLRFPRPSRNALAPLSRYARVQMAADPAEADHPETRLVGYAETSRGCLDTCRHCPVPAVYGGRFFVIPAEVVLADIAAQVDAGAQHITFGDPDFLNGPGHGMAILRRMHARWPALSFDITAQVTHLLRHVQHLAELAALGCAFVVSAVESLSDQVLARLNKRHRRADFEQVLDLCTRAGLVLRPTFVAFTPWTTLADMIELVDFIAARGLVDHVDPVQLTIRLLVPPGSLLLEHAQPGFFGPLDPQALTHRWAHPDPRMDALQHSMVRRVELDAAQGADPAYTFAALRGLVHGAAGRHAPPMDTPRARARVPRVTEPWFC